MWITSEEVVRQLMLMAKDKLHGRTESTGNLGLQQGSGSLEHFNSSHFPSFQPSSCSFTNPNLSLFKDEENPSKNKVTHDQWKFEIRSIQNLYSEPVICVAKIKPSKGAFADLMSYLGPQLR